MNYKDLLEKIFIRENEKDLTRLEYLSQNIFDFTTYDGEMDKIFAAKAVEVCNAITESTTFEYIKDQENYRWYLMMCNTVFFADRLDWGTSIRGAWWDYHIKLESCGLWEDGKQLREINFTQTKWKEFIKAVIEFSKA